MPPRTKNETDKNASAAPESPPPATVAVQRYDAGEGWDVGQRAPEDRYIEVGPDGADIGKPSKTPPKGAYARQIQVKGDVVTPAARAALGLDK
jgi:hypothetical protein